MSFRIWNKRDDLRLGIDRSTVYQHFEISIRAGDLLLLYTDSFVEGFNSDAKQLGEQGLLESIQSIPSTTPYDQFGRKLLSSVRAYSDGVTDDDETLILIRFGRGRRSPGIFERLRGYATAI